LKIEVLVVREDHKFVKSVLESWGTYKRQSFSVLGLPKSTPAFDPENYEYQYASPPSWRRKRIPQKDEKNYRQMRQQSTKPSMGARIPNYISNTRMNHVDTLIKRMEKVHRETAKYKFIDELKNKEIAEVECTSVDTVEKRVRKIYLYINEKLDRRYFRKKPEKNRKNRI